MQYCCLAIKKRQNASYGVSARFSPAKKNKIILLFLRKM
tara:strand:+ start:1086 stop:1202 length:117 start_codon:yes stop_codon:yes gene_type:complete